MVTCATWEIEARASPRKPYDSIEARSSNARSLDVVNRSHTCTRTATVTLPRQHHDGAQRYQRHVGLVDAVPIVCNLKQLQAAVLDHDGDAAATAAQQARQSDTARHTTPQPATHMVEPASREFSSISFNAADGRTTTSPAAMRFTTASSRRSMRRALIVRLAPKRDLNRLRSACAAHT
jgi:hypothetical protein